LNLASRKFFKIIGLFLIISGIIIIGYASFILENSVFMVQRGGLDSEPQVVRGETSFQRITVGFVGALAMFIGYRMYKFIPYAEREKEMVSELDLSEI
jgi:hypothetical protein